MLSGKVLVLGGAGFVGRSVVNVLSRAGIDVVVGSRSAACGPDVPAVKVNAESPSDIRAALKGVSIIVNCITGSASTIQRTCRAITAEAARKDSPPGIVHMSTMSIYGRAEGEIQENSPPAEPLGWYGEAKRQAEEDVNRYAESGAPCTILRVGCVFGPESPLWVDRIGLLLRRGRLGDIGILGDGWSNLVHVNDVGAAVLAAVSARQPRAVVYNVAAPDSPRWNTYFKDLAAYIGVKPLRHKTVRAMHIESYLRAPPAKLFERLSRSLPIPHTNWPSIPPSLLRLWGQQIRLDSRKVTSELNLKWTPYQTAVKESAASFTDTYGDE